MVTPTGAAFVKALARPATLPLNFEIEKIGYGAGARTLADRPNVLRMMLGREHSPFESDEMIEIAANIDDLNPQIYDHVMERLFGAGARDVTLTPTIMKKGRPAVTLGVIAEAADRDKLARIIFDETSTIGLRFHSVLAPETASRGPGSRDALRKDQGKNLRRPAASSSTCTRVSSFARGGYDLAGV